LPVIGQNYTSAQTVFMIIYNKQGMKKVNKSVMVIKPGDKTNEKPENKVIKKTMKKPVK
jgi:hypothetical protein